MPGEQEDLTTYLSRLLVRTAEQMRAEFARSAGVQHRGEKGSLRERAIIAGLLRDVLPGNVRVNDSCEIVDVTGRHSPQIDVAIYDPVAPPLFRERGGDFRVFPSECIYGTIEVKTKLDGTELKRAIQSAREIKRLAKKEFYWEESSSVREQHGSRYSYCPTACFVFAYESIDLGTLATKMASIYSANRIPPEERIDAIWVLGKGALLWFDAEDDTVINPAPNPGDRIGISDALDGQDILLNMVSVLNKHFSSAWMPPFKIDNYIGDAPQATIRGFAVLLDPELDLDQLPADLRLPQLHHDDVDHSQPTQS